MRLKSIKLTAFFLCLVCLLSVLSCGKKEPYVEVTYEIAADKGSVTFLAKASASGFENWSFYVETDGVVSVENVTVDNTMFYTYSSKKLTPLNSGETYIAFYTQASSGEYTKIFGYFVTVDSLLQISVEVAESDSMLGKE